MKTNQSAKLKIQLLDSTDFSTTFGAPATDADVASYEQAVANAILAQYPDADVEVSCALVSNGTKEGTFVRNADTGEALEMMTTSELVGWSETVTEGEYLACYEDDGLDEVSDPGSRCGYDDATLDQVRRWLRARDLTIRTDDRGIRVESDAPEEKAELYAI